jgi:hypothetical protein
LNHQTGTSGPDASYSAGITVLDDGREITTGAAGPGAPLRYREINISLLTHGPLVHVTATSAEGGPLPLQALAPSGQIVNEVTVQFDEDEREGYVAVPERDLVLRLVLEAPGSDLPESGNEVLIEAYRGEQTVAVSSVNVDESGSVEIDGDSYHIDWGRYAVLGASRDLTILPVGLGATLIFAGSTAVLLFRHRFVWATVKGHEGVTQIEVFNPAPQQGGQPAADFVQLVSHLKENFGVH